MAEDFSHDPRLQQEYRPRSPGFDDIFPPGEDAPPPSSHRRKSSKSRSRSPDGRSRHRNYDDSWNKNTDAFLQKLSAPPVSLNMSENCSKTCKNRLKIDRKIGY